MTTRGRPRKIMTEGESKVERNKYVHYLTWISGQNISNPGLGIVTAAEASAVLQSQYELGYTVKAVTPLGQVAEGNAYGFLYLLELND